MNTSTPSSSTMMVIPELDSSAFDLESQVSLVLTSLLSSNLATGLYSGFHSVLQNDVKLLVDDLMRLEDKMLLVRRACRFEPHTSATSCMYNK